MRAGQLIAGRYRLDSWIGSGGMGEVWQATDVELRRIVAVKHIRPRDGDDERAYRLMMREARIAANLQHPNIVMLFDVVTDGADRYLIMEYVAAPHLAAAMETQGSLTPRQVARIGAQLADALAAVHATGIVHGDVKPTNVLVATTGATKLTDFGISRMMVGDPTLTDTGGFVGTPAFMAPEVAAGEDVTPASDLFSLGATLYAAIEGESPYGSTDNVLVTLRRAATGEVRPCRRAGPLAPALDAMLSRDPAARPDAGRARELLDEIADGISSAPEPAARRGRFGRRRLIGAGAVLACAVLVAGVLVLVDGQGHGHGAAGAGRPTGSAAKPVATGVPAAIDDTRTADPCALMSAGPLARFGATQTDPHYGNFDRCDILVSLPNNVTADVEAQFLDPGTVPAPAPSPIGTARSLSVAREAEQGGECDRILTLPDHYQIDVDAKRDDQKGTGTCAMADVATGSAVAALDRGAVPSRALPAGSLAQVDACRLLDATVLKRSAGVAGSAQPGFGNWECQWSAGSTSVTLRFDQDTSKDPLNGSAQKLGGHAGSVQAQGPGSCEALVEYRSYADVNGDEVHELVDVTVNGQQSSSALCGSTRKLAASAAAALPRA